MQDPAKHHERPLPFRVLVGRDVSDTAMAIAALNAIHMRRAAMARRRARPDLVLADKDC